MRGAGWKWMDGCDERASVCTFLFFLSFRAALGFGTTPRYYNYVS